MLLSSPPNTWFTAAWKQINYQIFNNKGKVSIDNHLIKPIITVRRWYFVLCARQQTNFLYMNIDCRVSQTYRQIPVHSLQHSQSMSDIVYICTSLQVNIHNTWSCMTAIETIEGVIYSLLNLEWFNSLAEFTFREASEQWTVHWSEEASPEVGLSQILYTNNMG